MGQKFKQNVIEIKIGRNIRLGQRACDDFLRPVIEKTTGHLLRWGIYQRCCSLENLILGIRGDATDDPSFRSVGYAGQIKDGIIVIQNCFCQVRR